MNSAARLASVFICLVMIFPATAASGGEQVLVGSLGKFDSISIRQTSDQETPKKIQKLLSDHPGSATALTVKQKAEIRNFVKKVSANKTVVCTGLSLSGQRASMYRVVRLRAELVCQYAKSLDTELETVIRERTVNKRIQNGRVLVSSN